MNQAVKSICKLIDDVGRRHHRWQVFSDFVEMGACAVSNKVDFSQYDVREDRYMQIVKKYEKDEIQAFPKMLAELFSALDGEPQDLLGMVFHELELHNKYTGQFFTPYSLCQLMASMQVDENTDRIIEQNGFITLSEPACGSGAMIIAFADALKQRCHDISKTMHVTATDVDVKCVHMAFLQLSLIGIPGLIIHGNTLSLEEWAVWGTPHHIIDRWPERLRHRQPEESIHIPPIKTPSPTQMMLFGDL